LLDSVDAVIKYASTMTWKGKHSVVELVATCYQTGVKLTKEAMEAVETHIQRLPSLEKGSSISSLLNYLSGMINCSCVPKVRAVSPLRERRGLPNLRLR
jgi:hypothetical protein